MNVKQDMLTIGTPGPNGCMTLGKNGEMIAVLAHSVKEDSQQKAATYFARLLAGAPVMYRILEDLITEAKSKNVSGVPIELSPELLIRAESLLQSMRELKLPKVDSTGTPIKWAEDRIDSFSGEYRWLSNFWPCSVTWDGFAYASVEHAYQASKAASRFREQFRREGLTPGQAKRLGSLIVPPWDHLALTPEQLPQRKLDIMEKLLRRKFVDGSPLADRLRETGSIELVEGNTWGDVFWGECGGKGENHLGRLIMKIRAELLL